MELLVINFISGFLLFLADPKRIPTCSPCSPFTTASLSFSLSPLPTFSLSPLPTCFPFIKFTVSPTFSLSPLLSFAVVLKVNNMHCHGCAPSRVVNDPLKLRKKLDGKTKKVFDDLAGRFGPLEEVQVEGKKDEAQASFVLKIDMRHSASRVPVNKPGELAVVDPLKVREKRERKPPVYISGFIAGVHCKSTMAVMALKLKVKMKRSIVPEERVGGENVKRSKEGNACGDKPKVRGDSGKKEGFGSGEIAELLEKLDVKTKKPQLVFDDRFGPPEELEIEGKKDEAQASFVKPGVHLMALKLKEKMKRSIVVGGENVKKGKEGNAGGDKPKVGEDSEKNEGFGGGEIAELLKSETFDQGYYLGAMVS